MNEYHIQSVCKTKHSKLKESPLVAPRTHVEPTNGSHRQLTLMFRIREPEMWNMFQMYDEPADECSFHGNDTEESEEEETTVHENEAEGSDEEDGEEGEAGKVVKRDLEWDDSTLTY